MVVKILTSQSTQTSALWDSHILQMSVADRRQARECVLTAYDFLRQPTFDLVFCVTAIDFSCQSFCMSDCDGN